MSCSSPTVHRRIAVAMLSFWVLLAAGCMPLSPDYSLDAYKTATTLKAETLALMSKANEPYRRHEDEIDALSTKIDAAYEFAAHRRANAAETALWDQLRAPDGQFFGTFLVQWRKSGTVGEYFIGEYRGQVAEIYDTIICVEANREKDAGCKATGGKTS